MFLSSDFGLTCGALKPSSLNETSVLSLALVLSSRDPPLCMKDVRSPLDDRAEGHKHVCRRSVRSPEILSDFIAYMVSSIVQSYANTAIMGMLEFVFVELLRVFDQLICAQR